MKTDDELYDELAKRVWCIGAGDMMVPRIEAARRWENHKAAKTQEYLNRRHDAMAHLIALEEMGAKIEVERLGTSEP